MSPQAESSQIAHDAVTIEMLRIFEAERRRIFVLRLTLVVVGGLCIVVGAVMCFLGLGGAFDLGLSGLKGIQGKITSAGPGIGFATIGCFFIAFAVSKIVTRMVIDPVRNARSDKPDRRISLLS